MQFQRYPGSLDGRQGRAPGRGGPVPFMCAEWPRFHPWTGGDPHTTAARRDQSRASAAPSGTCAHVARFVVWMLRDRISGDMMMEMIWSPLSKTERKRIADATP